MRSLPLGSHDAHYYRNSSMDRYDVRCRCGWTAYGDERADCEEAYIAHLKEEKAPEK